MASADPPTLSPLSFPPSTFAKLTPGPYLAAHLSAQPPTRPSSRSPTTTRRPHIHTSSLRHSSGSAVVRIGSTSVVAGIRPEILRAQDIPDPSATSLLALGLLVPNVELSTGSSPANLPGQAPTGAAQALTHRLHSALQSTRILDAEDLAITAEEEDEDGTRTVVKAYWALYIDVLLMSDDGAVFDAVWAAALAALRDTMLPAARWDADREAVVCSPLREGARRLNVRGLPAATSFAVFSTGSKIRGEEGQAWVLADPDALEEGVCREGITVMIGEEGRVLGIEKSGGAVVGVELMRELVSAAQKRWVEWKDAMA